MAVVTAEVHGPTPLRKRTVELGARHRVNDESPSWTNKGIQDHMCVKKIMWFASIACEQVAHQMHFSVQCNTHGMPYSAIHMVCRIVAASKLFAAWQQQGSSQCPSAAGAGMGPSKSGNISYTFCGYVQHGQHCTRKKKTHTRVATCLNNAATT